MGEMSLSTMKHLEWPVRDVAMICPNCGTLLKDESELREHGKACPGMVQGRC